MWLKVKSSNIYAICYSPLNKRLGVKFFGALDKAYFYQDVPIDVWLLLTTGQSVGRNFHRLVKLGKFEFTCEFQEMSW